MRAALQHTTVPEWAFVAAFILFDAACTGFDLKLLLANQLSRNLEPCLEGRTVIIVAHRLSTVRKLADQIVVLDETGIAEPGSHADVIARGGWYAEMARLQSVGVEEDFRPRLVRAG